MRLTARQPRRCHIHAGLTGFTGAFTLVELMVVVLIIILMLTIMVPTLSMARRSLLVNKSQYIINLIEGACHQYHGDVGEYPPSLADLVQALTGYLGASKDYKDGFGWRKAPRGKVYGPYNGTEKLELFTRNVGVARFTFKDAFDNPILYYRCTVTPPAKPGDPPTFAYKRVVMADLGPDPLEDYLKGPGGKFYRTDFVLITPGPDSDWSKGEIHWEPYYKDGHWTRSDDIANFGRK